MYVLASRDRELAEDLPDLSVRICVSKIKSTPVHKCTITQLAALHAGLYDNTESRRERRSGACPQEDCMQKWGTIKLHEKQAGIQ